MTSLPPSGTEPELLRDRERRAEAPPVPSGLTMKTCGSPVVASSRPYAIWPWLRNILPIGGFATGLCEGSAGSVVDSQAAMRPPAAPIL